MFCSCHHNRAKPAYETVHHHIHATLQDCLRSSLWRFIVSFSVWDADCWRRRHHIGPVQYVGGREADEHPCAHSFPQPFVSRTITNIYTNILINLHCFYLSQQHFHKSNRLRCQCKWLAVDYISMHRITPYIKTEFADIYFITEAFICGHFPPAKLDNQSTQCYMNQSQWYFSLFCENCLNIYIFHVR